MWCSICMIFCANENCNNKCSVCFKKEQANRTEITLDDLITCNDDTISSEIYEANLKKLFKHYASKKLKDNYILIDTPTKYKTFRNVLEPYIKNYASFRKFMCGKREYPVIFLTSKYADLLLLDLEKLILKNYLFGYVHQIANRTIDVWNVESKNGVLLCYHKDFGDFVTCPNNYEKLKELWNKHKRGLHA